MKLFQILKEYALITFGLFLLALGWTAFIIPSEITGGGVSGISTIIFFASDKTMPVGISYLLINSVLVVIAIKVLGKSFGVKTIFAIAAASLLFTFLQKAISQPVVEEKFMAAIIGAVMSGVGIGITFSQGGSTGGTDIIALMINKYKNISPGRLLLYIDVIIISSLYFVLADLPPVERIQALVYGGVVMTVSSYSVDLLISGNKQSMQLFIFSLKYDEIADTIVNDCKRGVTVMDGMGWHSKTQQKVLIVMIRKTELSNVYKIIKQIDPEAFMSVNSVMGVYGKGFDQIKT